MPISVLEFDRYVQGIIDSDDFIQNPEYRGGMVTQAINKYNDLNADTDDERIKIREYGQNKLQEFRNTFNEPRYQPSQEERQLLEAPLPSLSSGLSISEQASIIDEWKQKNIEAFSADNYRSAEKEDIEVFYNQVANNIIRQKAYESNSTTRAGDLFWRLNEGFVRPIHSIFDKEGADRTWAQRAPENPNLDESFFSQLAGGAGDFASQIVVSGLGGLVGGVYGAAGASMLFNSARYMKAGYDMEWERTGNESQAWDSALTQIPAAALESVADTIFFGMGSKTYRVFAKEFAQATTAEAKKAVLKRAILSHPQRALRSGLAEGTIGGMGTEWASGIGMSLATGHKEYEKSFGDILMSGAVEGTLGALFGFGMSTIQRSGQAQALSSELSALEQSGETKAIRDLQSNIQSALQRRDFGEVLRLTKDNKLISDPKQQQERYENYDASRGLYTDPETGEAVKEEPPIDTSTPQGQERARMRSYDKTFGIGAGRSLFRSFLDETNKDSEVGKLLAVENRTQEQQERLDYLTKLKTDIESGNAVTDNKLTAKVDTLPDAAGIHGPSNPEAGSHQVILEDGTPLAEGDNESTFYLTGNKSVLANIRNAIRNIKLLYNKDIIFAPSGKEDGKILLRYQKPDGSWTAVGTQNKDGTQSPFYIDASFKPVAGAIPVSFVDHGDGNVEFNVHNQTVKESKRIPTDFEIVDDSRFESDGVLTVRSKRNKDKVVELHGNNAKAVMTEHQRRQDEKNEKLRRKDELIKQKEQRKKQKESGGQLTEDENQMEFDWDSELAAIEVWEKEQNQLQQEEDNLTETENEESSRLARLERLEQQKAADPKVRPDSTLEESNGKRGYANGKQGTVQRTEDGMYEFVFDDTNETPLTLGGANGIISETPVTRTFTNQQSAMYPRPPGQPQQRQQPGQPKISTEFGATITQRMPIREVKDHLKSVFPKFLHKTIDKLNNDTARVLGNAIQAGIQYQVMTDAQAKAFLENQGYETIHSPRAFSAYDPTTGRVINVFISDQFSETLLEKDLLEETIHAAEHLTRLENPELHQKASQELLEDVELMELMRQEYPDFDSQPDSLKVAETIRAIVEGRFKGKPRYFTSGKFSLREFIQKFLDKIQEFFGSSMNRNAQVAIQNIEEVLGITYGPESTLREVGRDNIARFNAIIRGEDRGFLDEMNRNDLRHLANMLKVSTAGTKQNIIDRINSKYPQLVQQPIQQKQQLIQQPVQEGSELVYQDNTLEGQPAEYTEEQVEKNKQYAENPVEDVQEVTDANPGIDNDIESALGDADKAAIVQEFEGSNWDSVKERFREEFANFLNGVSNVSQVIIDIFERVLKALKIGGAIASLTLTPTNSNYIQNISFDPGKSVIEVREDTRNRNISPDNVIIPQEMVPDFSIKDALPPIPELQAVAPESRLSTTESMKPKEAKKPNFGKNEVAPKVKQFTEWVIENNNHEGYPFVIADKQGGVMYIFNKNGKLTKKTPALYGKQIGDVSDTTAELYSERNRTTPAGRFFGELNPDLEYGKTVDFYSSDLGDWTIAIHKVYLEEPSERRQQRLDSESPLDNRISYGCINISQRAMVDNIIPLFDKNGGYVYVLPETPSGRDEFIEQTGAPPSIPFAYNDSIPENRFVFRLAEQFRNAEDSILGLQIKKDGTVPLQSLEAKIKSSGVISFERDRLISLLQDVAIGGRVNVRDFSEAIDNEPTVTITVLNAAENQKNQLDIFVHFLETRGFRPRVPVAGPITLRDRQDNDVDISQLDSNTREIFEMYVNIIEENNRDIDELSKAATGRFGVDPYTDEELEGVEELEPGHHLIWSGDIILNIPGEEQYDSHHYKGVAAKNQVGFVRGAVHEYQAGNQLPDGTVAELPTRIMEIWEVQSDWKRAPEEVYNKDGDYFGHFIDGVFIEGVLTPPPDAILDKDTKSFRNSLISKGYTIISNPGIVNNYESLALKAALNHARQLGASHIFISDAETAMMTEEHDSYAIRQLPDTIREVAGLNLKEGDWVITFGGAYTSEGVFKTKDEADRYLNNMSTLLKNYHRHHRLKQLTQEDIDTINNEIENFEISQASGMRAAYDNRLPNGLVKLVNNKGKKVTLGKHKNTSPIFKNPDGTRKNTNTGTLFSIPETTTPPLPGIPFAQNQEVLSGLGLAENSSNVEKGAGIPFAQDQQIPVEVIPGLFGIPEGSVDPGRLEKVRQLKKARKRKLEAKLAPEERKAYEALMNLNNGAMLSDESFNEFIKTINDFVDTRRKTKTDLTERDSAEVILNKTSEWKKEADNNMFENLKETFPFLEGKDFANDFKEDLDLVRVEIEAQLKVEQLQLEADGSMPTRNQEMRFSFMERSETLRDAAFENIDEFLDQATERIDEVSFVDSQSFGAKHLNKGNQLLRKTMEDLKSFYREYINYLLTVDLEQLSDADLRRHYYALMGVTYDSYMITADNFVSSEITDVLSTDQNFVSAFPGHAGTRGLVTKISSIATQRRAITANNQAYNSLLRITSRLNESIRRAEQFRQEVMIQYQKDAAKHIKDKYGRNLTSQDLNTAGIYAELTKIREDESVEVGVRRNIDQLRKSFENERSTADKNLKNESDVHDAILNQLTDGIFQNQESILESIERNANNYIGGYIPEYTQLLRDFFNQFEPMSKFTTEFVYGRQYKRFHNYMPTMVMTLAKNGDSSWNQVPAHEAMLNMTHNDMGELDVNTAGMSSTYDKTRALRDGQALVLNINHLFGNRGRLNFLDYFTSVYRREMHTLMKPGTDANNQLRQFLDDPKGLNGRIEIFNNSTVQNWRNVIDSVQYLAPVHGFFNNLAGRWAGNVLSSAYQFITQYTSAIIPYLQINIGTPSKMADVFTATSYLSKYVATKRFGMNLLEPHQVALMDNLMFDLNNRHPDAILDTSVELAPSKIIDWFKNIPGFEAISKIDKAREWLQFSQFKGADYTAGGPILLVEYLHNLREKTGNNTISFEDMTFDPSSYFAALDESERFIGIGAAARRGELMNNRNAFVTILRHVLTGFAGHRINNATNFETEMRRVLNDETSMSDKVKSLNYMAGIATQAAVFSLGKAGIIMLMMSAFKNMLSGDDEDDDVIALYNRRANASTPEQRKLLDIEISQRRESRKVWNQIKQTQDGSHLALKMTKDVLQDIFVIPSVLEFVPDILVWNTVDRAEEESFKQVKAQRLEELKRMERNARNLGERDYANKLRLQISDLESLQSVRLTHANFTSLVPFSGMYGGLLKSGESFFNAVRDDYFLGVEPMDAKDFMTGMGVFGYSTADINRYLTLVSKLGKADTKAAEKRENLQVDTRDDLINILRR